MSKEIEKLMLQNGLKSCSWSPIRGWDFSKKIEIQKHFDFWDFAQKHLDDLMRRFKYQGTWRWFIENGKLLDMKP